MSLFYLVITLLLIENNINHKELQEQPIQVCIEQYNMARGEFFMGYVTRPTMAKYISCVEDIEISPERLWNQKVPRTVYEK